MNMGVYNILLDILKLTVAGVGVVWAAFYLVKPYLDKNERLQILELKKAADNQTLPLRLQAYERVVYCCRFAPPGRAGSKYRVPAQYNTAGLCKQPCLGSG
jgi:hypothetical protein